MAQRLSSMFKLATPEREPVFLGMLVVPDNVARYLEDGREFTAPIGVNYAVLPSYTSTSVQPAHFMVRTFHIGPAPYPMDDSICLYGIEPEAISQERGYAFLPSAEYIRRNRTVPKVDAERPTYKFPEVDFA